MPENMHKPFTLRVPNRLQCAPSFFGMYQHLHDMSGFTNRRHEFHITAGQTVTWSSRTVYRKLM